MKKYKNNRDKVAWDIGTIRRSLNLYKDNELTKRLIDLEVELLATVPDLDQCICSEYDGKGKSVCGLDCPVHPPEKCKHKNTFNYAKLGGGIVKRCHDCHKDLGVVEPTLPQLPEIKLIEKYKTETTNMITEKDWINLEYKINEHVQKSNQQDDRLNILSKRV